MGRVLGISTPMVQEPLSAPSEWVAPSRQNGSGSSVVLTSGVAWKLLNWR